MAFGFEHGVLSFHGLHQKRYFNNPLFLLFHIHLPAQWIRGHHHGMVQQVEKQEWTSKHLRDKRQRVALFISSTFFRANIDYSKRIRVCGIMTGLVGVVDMLGLRV
jgi:hypothetical protein